MIFFKTELCRLSTEHQVVIYKVKCKEQSLFLKTLRETQFIILCEENVYYTIREDKKI